MELVPRGGLTTLTILLSSSFHSLIIGLTLAVNEEFITLFIVLVFHQMFEGLGLGSRLSSLPLPSKFKWGESPSRCPLASTCSVLPFSPIAPC